MGKTNPLIHLIDLILIQTLAIDIYIYILWQIFDIHHWYFYLVRHIGVYSYLELVNEIKIYIFKQYSENIIVISHNYILSHCIR